MTTIVWDGRALATDSRGTRAMANGHECGSCGHKESTVIDALSKIHNKFNGSTFKGEEILAIAGTGNSTEIDIAIALVRAKIDLVVGYKTLEISKSNGNAHTLIVVTESEVHELEYTRGSTLKVTSRAQSIPGKWGSGSQSLLMLDALNVTYDAVQGVIAAIAADKYSGGAISVWYKADPLVIKEEAQPATEAERKAYLTEAILEELTENAATAKVKADLQKLKRKPGPKPKAVVA